MTERHQMQQALQEAQQSMSQLEFKLFEKEYSLIQLIKSDSGDSFKLCVFIFL